MELVTYGFSGKETENDITVQDQEASPQRIVITNYTECAVISMKLLYIVSKCLAEHKR